MFDWFGWELLYDVTEKDIRKKEDALVLLMHYVMIKNGFQCVGLGAEKTPVKPESASEVLPSGWNASKNYSLRYVRDKELYILKALPVDDNMVCNLLKVVNLVVSNVAFNVDSVVVAIRGPLAVMIPTKDELASKIVEDLLKPHKAITDNKLTTQTQTPTQAVPIPDAESRGSQAPTPCFVPGSPPRVDPFWIDPERDPLRVGGRDVNPLGRGGGMIFNPFDPRAPLPDPGAGIPGGIPRGSVPPGARFDPFAPPGSAPRPQRPPDPDS